MHKTDMFFFKIHYQKHYFIVTSCIATCIVSLDNVTYMLVACWQCNSVVSLWAVVCSGTCGVFPGLTNLFVKVSHGSIKLF